MFMLVGEIAIQALVLCAIMYFVARHEADYSFDKVFMVAAGIALGWAALTFLLFDRIGFLIVIPIFAFMAYMLVKFCWVSVPKSLLITLIFVIFQSGMKCATDRITGKIVASMDKSNALVEQRMKDTEEARQMMVESLQGAYHGGPVPAPSAPPADEVAIIQEVVSSIQQQVEAQKAQQIEAMKNAGFQAAVPAEAPPVPETPAEPEPVAAAEPAPSRAPAPVPAPAAAPAPQAPAEDWDGARKAMVISGISGRPGRFIAIVDGNMREAGDTVSVRHQGKTFTWTIRDITVNNLDLEPAGVQ